MNFDSQIKKKNLNKFGELRDKFGFKVTILSTAYHIKHLTHSCLLIVFNLWWKVIVEFFSLSIVRRNKSTRSNYTFIN